jgi:plasmid stability protein
VHPMATLVIKNLPDDLHAKLKQQAEDNRRSLTKEALTLLEQGVARQSAVRTPPLPPPLQLRGGQELTVEDIEAAIAEGRE